MKSCEVVMGGAFINEYPYCRSHKCDPEQCPKEDASSSLAFKYWTDLIARWEKKKGVGTAPTTATEALMQLQNQEHEKHLKAHQDYAEAVNKACEDAVIDSLIYGYGGYYLE